MQLIRLLLSALVLKGSVAIAEPVSLPVYQPEQVLSGNLSSMGSDTLNNLMTRWVNMFNQYHPQLNFQVQSAGSATAPVALLEGTASLAPMSRLMYDSEIRRFEQRFGYQPYALPVALDMLAVYVHRSNPLQQLTMVQLDALFSVNRQCGSPAALTRWGQLGLSGRWQQRDIALFGRNSASGTYGYFKKQVLCQGDFSLRTQELAGAGAVIDAVSSTPNAVGYAPAGLASGGVKVVPLAANSQDEALLPLAEHAISGRYPLARTLYLYINKSPRQPLAASEREFLRLVLSEQGRQLIYLSGYQPLPVADVLQLRQELGI